MDRSATPQKLIGVLLPPQEIRPCWERGLGVAGVDETTWVRRPRHLAGASAASAGASLQGTSPRVGHPPSDASLRCLKASARRDSWIADAIEQPMHSDLDDEQRWRCATTARGSCLTPD